MDIDMSILRMLEREKEISFDVLVEAIEQALLTAYHKTPGAVEQARVVLDRKSGHVTVLATETNEEGGATVPSTGAGAAAHRSMFATTAAASHGSPSSKQYWRCITTAATLSVAAPKRSLSHTTCLTAPSNAG